MRKTSLFLALFSLAALPAFGGVKSASVYEKNLSSADDWSDVSGQLKGRLPSNVVKEFADFAKGIQFPGTRRIKNKLVLTQNDGTRVTVEFKKGGVVSFNGKDWRFKPLGTVEEEVSRLALFLNGEKKASASFLGLEPAAQAGGAGGLGVAAAAFAGANAYKADACGEKDLSDELVYDCPLMAVKMRPVLVKAKAQNPEKLLPVSLKCPAENSGLLVLITMNAYGQSERLSVRYKRKKPVLVSVDIADTDSTTFQPVFTADMSSKNAVEVQSGHNVIKLTDPILKVVCMGNAKDRKRYFAYLESNRADLRKPAKNDSNDKKPSVESVL